HRLERLLHLYHRGGKRHRLFLSIVPANHHALLFGQVLWPKLDAQADADQLVLVELEAGVFRFVVVDDDAEALALQLSGERFRSGENSDALFRALADHHDGDVGGGQPRRDNQPAVVRVGHDQRADQPRRYPPGGLPDVGLLTVATLESGVERLGEILAEVVRSPGLQRSEEHTSELQSLTNLVCRLLLEKKKT